MAEGEDAVLLAKFSDLTPVLQDDGPNPLVRIDYSPQFVEVMNIFRAVLQADERSLRALELTVRVIQLNPANYTAWQYRRVLLESLPPTPETDMRLELQRINTFAVDNPKNYQIWHHRKFCLTSLSGTEVIGKELDWIEHYLRDPDLEDEKNYHAWGHRLWVLDHFKLWEGEVAFVDRMLQSDARNNSAWNQRYVAIFQRGPPVTDEVRRAEMHVALSYIAKDIDNESAWAYLRGVIKGRGLIDFGLEGEIDKLENGGKNRFVLEARADIAHERGDVGAAAEFFGQLMVVDAVRSKYWANRREEETQ